MKPEEREDYSIKCVNVRGKNTRETIIDHIFKLNVIRITQNIRFFLNIKKENLL